MPVTSDDSAVSTDAIVTIPNLLTLLRLLLVPFFLWSLTIPGAEGIGAGILVLSGITDYLDGVIARRTGQVSRLGQILDPLVDRITVIAVLLGLAVQAIVPWWLVGALLAREAMLLALVPLLRRHGLLALPVHYLGKAATFALFWAFPLVLVGSSTLPGHPIAHVLGWAALLWGLGLYWYAGLLYVDQAIRIARSAGARSGSPTLPPAGRDN